MPTKIIVTHNGELKKKYGTKLSAISKAITQMTNADAARGISTTFVALDDASFGQLRATRGKLKSFKDAVDHAYSLHQNPDYILILPWNLRAEIMEQMAAVRTWGAKFVVPIPTVTVFE